MIKKAFVFCFASVLMGGAVLLPAASSFAQTASQKAVPSAEDAEAAEKKVLEKAWKAPDQEAAKKRAAEIVPFVDTVVDECLLCRSLKLREQGYSVKDITHSYFLLESPIIKKKEDYYGPVRFMHAKHAAALNDCTVCHHLRPTDPKAAETTRCSACHQEAFKTDHPNRIGLKAAYHINCIDCHQQMNKGPVDCLGCHRKNIPDHKALVKLNKPPEPAAVTRECLRCHPQAGEDMLQSVHWLWRGQSAYTLEHRKEVRHGKGTTAINNF